MFASTPIEKTVEILRISINTLLDVYIYLAILVLFIYTIWHWEKILDIYVEFCDQGKEHDAITHKDKGETGRTATKLKKRLHTSRRGSKILSIKKIIKMFDRWIGGVATVAGARFIVSMSFYIRDIASPITETQQDKLQNIDLSGIITWGDLFATPGNIEQIQSMLGMAALSMLVFMVLGGIFYTLSMNSKVRKNAGQLMFLLACCIFVVAAFLQIYVVHTM